MAYFPDGFAEGVVIRVGWLHKGQPFTQGDVDDTFLMKLAGLYRSRINQTRGYHMCPFCPEPRFGLPVELKGTVIKLGSAELHVPALDGYIFVTPDLLYHYVVTHHYLPPVSFIGAVQRTI